MQDSLNKFIQENTGKPIDFDGWFGDQCVDAMNQFVKEVLGIQNPMQVLPGATAIAIFNSFTATQYFEKIFNTPEGVPQPGDIFFFGEPYGKYADTDGTIKYAGHVGIVVTADTDTVTLFEQNDPTGTAPRTKTYPYLPGAAGWLHFTGQIATTPLTPDGVNTYGLDGTNEASVQVVYDTWHKASQGLLVDVAQLNAANATILDLQKEILDLQSKHNEDGKELVNLNSALASLTSSNKEYATHALDAEKVAEEYTKYMDDIAETVGISNNNQTDQELHDEIIKEIILLQQNQKTAESQIPTEELLTLYKDHLEGIVNNAVEQGLNKYLQETNRHIIDLQGNPHDTDVANYVNAFVNDNIARLTLLQKGQKITTSLQQVVQNKGIENIFSKFIGLFIQTT